MAGAGRTCGRGVSEEYGWREEVTDSIDTHQCQSTQRVRLVALRDLLGDRRFPIKGNNRDLSRRLALCQDEINTNLRRRGDRREGFRDIVGRGECVVGRDRDGEYVVRQDGVEVRGVGVGRSEAGGGECLSCNAISGVIGPPE